MYKTHEQFILRAIALAKKGMDSNRGGPFGAVIVKDGEIIGEGSNQVTSTNDPTAHAEIVAIRMACQKLGTFQLDGCIMYTSCEPCPMCLGAIYWARPAALYYACTRMDAAAIGFDDDFIYREINLPDQDRSIPMRSLSREEGLTLFKAWIEKSDKIMY